MDNASLDSGRVELNVAFRASRGVAVRRAFTLVELLVVISIIGILVGLTMPAVQQAREAARRVTCQNNLKECAIALHHFHDAHGQFPPGCLRQGAVDHSWATFILPYLEQENLYNQIDLTKRWDAPGQNWAAAKTVVPVFRCPSSIFHMPGDTDYAGIRGSIVTASSWATYGSNGVLVRVSQDGPSEVRIADVTDGTSNTILVAESADRSAEEHGHWADGFNVFHSMGVVNQAKGEILSLHPQGAFTVFVDGSIHFLTSTADAYTVASLCTRNEGEVIAGNAL